MYDKAEQIVDLYASKAFNDAAMRKYLPGETYKQLKKTIDLGRPLDASLADIVANGMKRWALDMGATHYTHWFQPMNGFTAEKHESFISPVADGGIIMAKSWCAVNQMHRLFRRGGCAPLLRPEAIRRGTALLPPLSKRIRCIFRPASAHSLARCLTKRHRFFARWKL